MLTKPRSCRCKKRMLTMQVVALATTLRSEAMKDPNSNENPWRAVALVSAIGIDLVVCMLGGYWFGAWLNGRLGSPVWIVIGIMLGFIVGVASIIYILRSYSGGSNG